MVRKHLPGHEEQKDAIVETRKMLTTMATSKDRSPLHIWSKSIKGETAFGFDELDNDEKTALNLFAQNDKILFNILSTYNSYIKNIK